MMCQELQRLGVACRFDVLAGLHHGFLNFIKNSKDCLNASKFVTDTIRSALDPACTTTKPSVKRTSSSRK